MAKQSKSYSASAILPELNLDNSSGESKTVCTHTVRLGFAVTGIGPTKQKLLTRQPT